MDKRRVPPHHVKKKDCPPEVEPNPDSLTLAELNETLHEVIRSLKFHESMIEALLQMMTELDPVSIGRLRTHAAVALDQVHADRFVDPFADERESFWRHKFMMLDTVLARTGSYFKTAEIISLDDLRPR